MAMVGCVGRTSGWARVMCTLGSSRSPALSLWSFGFPVWSGSTMCPDMWRVICDVWRKFYCQGCLLAEGIS